MNKRWGRIVYIFVLKNPSLSPCGVEKVGGGAEEELCPQRATRITHSVGLGKTSFLYPPPDVGNSQRMLDGDGEQLRLRPG